MNFFEHQELARRNTRRLIVMMAAAVLLLIAITTAFISFAIYLVQTNSDNYLGSINAVDGSSLSLNWLNLEVGLWISVIVILAVATAAYLKWWSLRTGGHCVAESLGGEPVQPNTTNPDERRLLNVVEEMAIAAGVTVPSVYILEQPSINAFAAGHQISDAVIGVTRGCVNQLNRDQLQGVIAHEFSHILYGDMRLNIHLVSLLHGLMVVGLIGRVLVRGSSPRRYGVRRSGRRSGDGGLALVGLGLIGIGYSGTLCGRIIKANISRQREFLADASAVQFTRNPQGIGHALITLRNHQNGSALGAESEEYSHLFFGTAQQQMFSSWLATHPPIDERIKRVLPSWKVRGTSPKEPRGKQETQSPPDDAIQFFSQESATSAEINSDDQIEVAGQKTEIMQTSTVINRVGSLGLQDFIDAKSLLDKLPETLKESTKDPFSARAVIYCLLMTDNNEDTEEQWQYLKKQESQSTLHLIKTLYPATKSIDHHFRLTLLELAIPSLKLLSQSQYHLFKRNVMMLIKTDKQVSLLEWSMFRILSACMEPSPSGIINYSIKQSESACRLLLAAFISISNDSKATTEDKFTLACQELGIPPSQLQHGVHSDFQSLDNALRKLRRVKPLQKPQLLKAMINSIEDINKVSVDQWQLIRAIALSIDCPIPEAKIQKVS